MALSIGFGSGSSKSSGTYGDESSSVTNPIVYPSVKGPLDTWLNTSENVFKPIVQSPGAANPMLTQSYDAATNMLNDQSFLSPYRAVQSGLYRLNDEYAPQAKAANMTATQASAPSSVGSGTGAAASSPYSALFDANVLTPTLNAFDYGTDRAMSALDARTAGAGAFGNDRSGLAYSDLAEQRANDRAKLVNDLQNQGLTTAVGFGQQDASRALSAEQGNQQSALATALANLTASNDAARFNAQNTTANNQFNANQQADKQNLNLNALGQITGNQNSAINAATGIVNNVNTLGQQQVGNQIAASGAFGQPIQTAVSGLTGSDQYQRGTGWSQTKGGSSSFGIGA